MNFFKFLCASAILLMCVACQTPPAASSKYKPVEEKRPTDSLVEEWGEPTYSFLKLIEFFR